MTDPLPLSLYIHIPWCEKKCPYCDFNSHMAHTAVDEPAYVSALLEDLKQDLENYQTEVNSREISSIFIGGGTPSLFSAESLIKLLTGVEAQIPFSQDIEITLEANPGSSEAQKFLGFRQAGVNRLSIGVQSFNKQHLQSLGRVHNSEEALAAADFARQAGFNNFNLDLMFALPQQNTAQALADIKQAIALQPAHLSCYQLTIEPNTLFHHSPPVTPDDESAWQMQLALQTELADAGYRQYEVSAYAQTNRRCRHNLNYWQYGDYLGIGAGAHGKLSSENGSITRMWKIKHPATYLRNDNDFTGGVDKVDRTSVPFEFMMNALRLRDGFSLDLFTSRTHLPVSDISILLERHQSVGLISIENQHVTPTERGRQMLDSLLQDYLIDS